ncbi:MAG: N-acetylglucosamine-binding protein GbpA [Plesiomonas sp.]|uniref:N-acetylglucosamine-binding protein GbpA n=1 Tax=Plesiomonas sp. TaxID=2486279 RepID=UPI003F3594D3
MKLSKVALLTLAALSSNAWAHGYVDAPQSRAYACKTGLNSECGSVQWEPQSVEAPSGFPLAGPADGKLGSAGVVQFSELDAQTSTRWAKMPISSGKQKISWNFTANHVTREWRYYITKQNWDQNAPLTRDSFELTPFTVLSGNMQKPPMQFSHDIVVPERTGYQVIMAVWEVGDTTNSFYNLIDVMFDENGNGGEETPDAQWNSVGTIYPSVNLQAGDQVKARAFDAQGERHDLATTLTIKSDDLGEKNQWAYALADTINSSQTLYQAGQKDAQGKINPVYGQNTVYAKKNSGVERVEIQVIKAETGLPLDIEMSGLQETYQLVNGSAAIKFDVRAVGDLAVQATVYNHSGVAQAFSAFDLKDSMRGVELKLDNAQAGHHRLVVKASNKDQKVIQKSADFTLEEESTGPEEPSGEYDFTFPQSLNTYKAGTTVLQPKTGKVYECKPFPYSGYCIQWNNNAIHYEPGVGSNWQDAWIEKK